MRGERALQEEGNLRLFRFIPACAGNAHEGAVAMRDLAVHPRMRGERVLAVHRLQVHRRFIPACAGNAHPVQDLHKVRHGSSPHARGTRCLIELVHDNNRFIPACAGNARLCRARLPTWPVHPRMRGERTSSKLLIYRMKGEPSDSTKRSGC